MIIKNCFLLTNVAACRTRVERIFAERAPNRVPRLVFVYSSTAYRMHATDLTVIDFTKIDTFFLELYTTTVSRILSEQTGPRISQAGVGKHEISVENMRLIFRIFMMNMIFLDFVRSAGFSVRLVSGKI